MGIQTMYYMLIFLCLIPLVSRDKKVFCICTVFIIYLDQLTTNIIHSDYFFLEKFGVDLVYLLLIFTLIKNYCKPLVWCVLLSASINLYNYFDLSNNIIFMYWHRINIIIFEAMILILLSSSRKYQTFIYKVELSIEQFITKVKYNTLYIYSFGWR